MTIEEIQKIIEEFGDASERALQAGFDGVQIHGAHGYLVSQFLSSITNRRKDRWGGKLRNRMRFLLEVYDEIRRRTINEPLLIKLNCDDFSPDGFAIKESVDVAKILCNKGIDLIEVSGGGRGQLEGLKIRAKSRDLMFSELNFASHAEKIRNVTQPTPMSLVGGFRRFETMEGAVTTGLTDLISMSRPFISEPNLVKKLKHGQREVRCIRCDGCEAFFGKSIMACVLKN
jgi:2,4-dienoyl-CoA reductase-like NADH-dependent reductase (Old Yellow Enzyme family)